ncbi:MAG: Hint domain-containing protein, partial [Paracoccus sp. (in: a-proteobacteria)]|nr:Hint domain-containing protein [Paracoccus sp. (in: a-proteobacteria)]
MAVIEIAVYKTRVENGIVIGASEMVTLSIPDTDGDGNIGRMEWTAYIGGTLGHNSGSGVGLLWKGDQAGNKKAGYLYSSESYTNGTNIQPQINLLSNSFPPIDPDAVAICFLAGTRIAVPGGYRPVEDLRPGDQVLTRDAGPQPLVWTAATKVDGDRLDRNPNLRPIKFARGSLGPDCPHRPVFVSPQHRVMMRDAAGAEVLASARHLVQAGLPGARVIRRPGEFTLCHIAFASHHIVLAEGALMESFFPGRMAMLALDPAD